jgi:hypothetical protein
VSTSTYKSKVGACEIGGVDRQGAVHDPLVFKGAGATLTLKDDDGQTYDQTLQHALAAGTIEAVASPKKKES